MSPNEIAVAVLLLWILFSMLLTLLFMLQRLWLRGVNRHRMYPYSIYRQKKRKLASSYWRTFGLSIVIAIIAAFAWRGSL